MTNKIKGVSWLHNQENTSAHTVLTQTEKSNNAKYLQRYMVMKSCPKNGHTK